MELDVAPHAVILARPTVRSSFASPQRIGVESDMEEPLLLALGLVIAAGLAAVIVILLRPRAPVPDPAAGERLVALNSRLDGMATWLQSAHGQLQQTMQASQGQFQLTVNQRLDAVTARLGESLTASTN